MARDARSSSPPAGRTLSRDVRMRTNGLREPGRGGHLRIRRLEDPGHTAGSMGAVGGERSGNHKVHLHLRTAVDNPAHRAVSTAVEKHVASALGFPHLWVDLWKRTSLCFHRCVHSCGRITSLCFPRFTGLNKPVDNCSRVCGKVVVPVMPAPPAGGSGPPARWRCPPSPTPRRRCACPAAPTRTASPRAHRSRARPGLSLIHI